MLPLLRSKSLAWIVTLAFLAGCGEASKTEEDTTVSDAGGETGSDTGNETGSDAGDNIDQDNDRWRPEPGTTWQWQLLGDVDLSYDVVMYDIDLVDPPDATFEALREADRVIICYFSAGSWEEWRDDADDFPPESIGNVLDGWPDERWIDVRLDSIRAIMEARMDLAVARGCDGVEPDNVDGYINDNGLALTADDQLDFNLFLAEAAHARGLSIGLKNDLDQLDALVDHFDWALNEECAYYEECNLLSVFTDAGKAVFHVEYVDDWAEASALAEKVCGVAPELDTLIKTWDLREEWLACP